MTVALDFLANGSWSSKGAVAVSGIKFSGTRARVSDITTIDHMARHAYHIRPSRVPESFEGYRRQDATRTVEISARVRRREPDTQWVLISSILNSSAGEDIPDTARYDAVLFLSRLPDACALPTVSFGYGEIVFEWMFADKAVTASFEGDGCVGYAMLIDGKYVPGEGEEHLYGAEFPADLASYLSEPKIK